MKSNKLAIIAALAAGMTSMAAFAAYTGSPTTGEIQFQGELVNAACGLAPSSSPVVVDFGQIPTSALASGQEAGAVIKDIELQYCDTTVAQTVTVTYTPTALNANDPALAAIVGSASGAGIGMKDSASQDITWGQASSQVQLVNGTNKIPFSAYLKADNASGAVTPGAFQSTVNFQIDYQ
ncbi:fimbrial protein [Hafnia paralvei]|uniref:fimbrial protein n=1 Tax=Hafnia paralvei TaxID=546367 RepID=UPI0010338066|nr:fimbrial protein [Hafnia paralvei]TBL58049.1 type 1 fimbrial protein [Hafnia paralvei]